MLILTIGKECGWITGIFLKSDEHATEERGESQLTVGWACTGTIIVSNRRLIMVATVFSGFAIQPAWRSLTWQLPLT